MGKGKAFEKIDDYLDSITISKGTRGTYRSQLRTFVRWCGENGFHTIATGAAMYEHHIKREYEGKSSDRSTLYTVRGFARWVAGTPLRCARISISSNLENGRRRTL